MSRPAPDVRRGTPSCAPRANRVRMTLVMLNGTRTDSVDSVMGRYARADTHTSQLSL